MAYLILWPDLVIVGFGKTIVFVKHYSSYIWLMIWKSQRDWNFVKRGHRQVRNTIARCDEKLKDIQRSTNIHLNTSKPINTNISNSFS